jgi:hypothetical protein
MAVMSCPDCGQQLDDVPVGDPCLRCGGQRRDATVHAQTVIGVATVISPGVEIGYGVHRPWQQKWQDVQHGLVAIKDAYAQQAMSNEPVRRMVEASLRTAESWPTGSSAA